LDELSHEGRKALRLPLAIAILDADTVPFHIPQLAQPLPEGFDTARDHRRRARKEKSDPGELGGLLCLGGERQGEQAEEKRDDTADGATPHSRFLS
jgi:hypothetical protein